jgi:hypothetical protein
MDEKYKYDSHLFLISFLFGQCQCLTESISIGKTNITVQQNKQLFSPLRKLGSSRKLNMLAQPQIKW